MSESKLPSGMKLVFAPGCFDNFEGSQEELDSLVKEIEQAFENGDFLDDAKKVDMEELTETLSEDEVKNLMESFGNESLPRILQ
jgi:hypothetical protein